MSRGRKKVQKNEKSIFLSVFKFVKKYGNKKKFQKDVKSFISRMGLNVAKICGENKKRLKKIVLKTIGFFENLVKYVLKKLVLSSKYIDYYYSKYKLQAPRFLKFHLKYLLKTQGGVFFVILYFIFLILGIWKVNDIVNLSVGSNLATAFFFGTAAIVGSLLAIVTSFSQFAIQNAFSMLPKGFYEIAVNVWKYIVIFFLVGTIVFSLLIAGLEYGRLGMGFSGLSIGIALTLVGVSFFLIYLLNRQIYSDINPENVLLKAAKQAVDTLSGLYKTVANLARIEQRDPKKNITQSDLVEVEALFYQSPQVKTILNNVNLRLAYLFDYHDSLVSTEQKSAAREVLDYIRGTIIQYLISRKNNSLIFPEPTALLAMTSDSKDFLQPNLERLMSVSEVYMRKQDTYGIMHVVNLFIALANTSAEIKYLRLRRSENPILEQVRGYFDMIMQRAININSFEGIYQGLSFYKVDAYIAIEKHLHLELNSLYSTLWKLAASAISTRHEPALGEIFNVYTFVLDKLIVSRYFNLEIELSYLLRHLKDLTYFSYLSVVSNGTTRDNLFTQNDIGKPYEKLRDLSFWIVQQASRARSQRQKEEWQSIFITVVDELRQIIRDLAQELKNADHILVLIFGQIIRDIGKLLVDLANDGQWTSHYPELKIQITSYMALPHWFVSEAEKIDTHSSTYDSLVEAVAQMGLAGLQKGMTETALSAMRIVFQFANDMFTKEKPERHLGFTEPRTVEYACYIGILALKLGKEEMIQSLIPQIRSFEEAYLRNHFSNVPEGIDIYRISPSPNRLREEVEGLIQDRNRWQFERWGLYDARETLFGLIGEEDISNFVDRVWPRTEAV
ncbi:MAG: hypothetical protein ACD_19C00426G0121 [uncultured bacterium]|nr:MAG: hypothetical protein ACD_19C00426G0121 [uncultured bacterium]